MLIRPGVCTPSRAFARGRGGLRLPVLTLFVAAAALWSAACSSDAPTAVGGVDVLAAKGGSSGGGGGKPGGGGPSGGPAVKSTNPSSAPQDTTLDVRVLGTGFDDGSAARFLLNGNAVPDVRTNSTRFVTSKELVANVTIAANAVTDLYDVEVTTLGGKRGVGIELFEVTATPIELTGLSRRGSSVASGINDAGVIVGHSADRSGTSRAVRWLPDGEGWGAPEALASGFSTATAINDAGFIAGYVYAGQDATAVVWRPDGTQVVLGPGFTTDINENNTVVGSVPNVGSVAWRYDPSRGEWRVEVISESGDGNVNGISDSEVAVGRIPNGNMELAVTWKYANGQWNGPTVMDHEGAAGGWVMDATAAGIAGGLWVQSEPDCGLGVHPAAAFWSSPTAKPTVIPGLEGSRSWLEDINAHGVVLGGRNTSGCLGSARALIWTSSAGVRLLAPLRGDAQSEAWGLNDAGQVVGASRGATGLASRAVVWVLP